MTWEEMLQLPIKEREKWMETVNMELMSLEKHKVWEIADLAPGKRTISAKWVFKAKHDDQGNIHTYKARLIARGFSQIQGRDYDESFAPVVRHETVRILFAVAAMKTMHVQHIDVKTAYLNGKLDEELFVEPPPAFDQPTTDGKVLRLRRSLYELKQSARVWNQVATDSLRKLGFRPNRADPCLFSRKVKNSTMSYVLIYIDDLLIAGSSPELTCYAVKQLNSYFEIKYLGKVRQYLSMQVEREGDGSFLLCQAAKGRHLLKEHGLLDAKPVATPMEANFLSSTLEESKATEQC
uniref:Reverse transcriptase Ty1/copia-type domain-containing protein n=1 Tax=Trichuris muris TaxID=70415 RepID=A0A5S6R0A3_TRIMR